MFKDHFSEAAERYARFRPDYPPRLFRYLADHAPACTRAWDCGTGSGQAARGLANHFGFVVASDASRQQLERRRRHPRVGYVLCLAEAAPLPPASLDLVVGAQAVHWFDIEAFYAEARRTARPDGLIAVWSYNLCRVTPAVDRIVERYYSEIVGPYWPPERSVVETGYRSIPFPFREIEPPQFEMEAMWRAEEFASYLGTWSSSQAYRKAKRRDPIETIASELTRAWGSEKRRRVSWLLHLRVGHVT